MDEILTSIRDIISGKPDDEKMNAEANKNEGPKAEEPIANSAPEAEEAVLELTEEVKHEEPKPVEAKASEQLPTNEEKIDVLANIDQALEQNKEAPKAENANKEGSTVEPKVERKTEEKGAEPAPVKQGEVAPMAAEKPAETTPASAAPAAPSAAPAADGQKTESLLTDEAAKRSAESLQNLMSNIPKPKILSPAYRTGNTLEDLTIEALKPLLSEWLNQNLPVIVKQVVEKEVKKLLPKE